MSDDQRNQQMHCPECGEDAVRLPPADLVPWEAHGLARPEWSHKDGSSLCPVIGPSGGYQPAPPQPRRKDAETSAARLQPPSGMRPSMRTEVARHLADREQQGIPGLPAGTAGPIGRRHMTRVIAQLGDPRRQAAAEARRPEPEAGA